MENGDHPTHHVRFIIFTLSLFLAIAALFHNSARSRAARQILPVTTTECELDSWVGK
jgi:hypothetical protein